MLIRGRLAACLSAGVLIVFAGASGAAAQGASVEVNRDGPSLIVPEGPSAGLEKLEKPILSEDVAAWADTVQREFDGHPQFHAVEISDSRTEATIWWHGEPTPQLDVAVATPLSAAVKVASTPYSPGELQDAVDRLFGDPVLSVVYASIRPDGSGIDISTNLPQGRLANPTAQIQELAGVPVSIVNEEVEPYQNRQDDRYLIGGARWGGFQNGSYVATCSSGFSITNRTTAVKGMLTASHCGPVGSQWGPQVGNTIYTVGPMTSRQMNIDTAVIEVPATAPTRPYIYTGAFNSGSITEINGNRNAPINAEICYSGSYTGLVCGNFIKTKSAQWNLGGDLSAITGLRTERTSTAAAAGQGDSGGPGYVLTNEAGVLKRYAAAVISAGPDAQFGNCPGLEAERLCGPTVLAGETWRFSSQTSWNISTLQ